MEEFYEIKDDYAILKLSANIYPLISIQKAIANYIDKVYIKLEDIEEKIIIKMMLKNKNDSLKDIIGEFYNELLRESLRYNISVETKNLRELIVGRALYTTCIETQNNESDTNNESTNEEEDFPLDEIAVNWFLKQDDLK